jgi:hypothetical protein
VTVVGERVICYGSGAQCGGRESSTSGLSKWFLHEVVRAFELRANAGVNQLAKEKRGAAYKRPRHTLCLIPQLPGVLSIVLSGTYHTERLVPG